MTTKAKLEESTEKLNAAIREVIGRPRYDAVQQLKRACGLWLKARPVKRRLSAGTAALSGDTEGK